MENRDLLKLSFEAGKEYGSNRTDKNFNDFLDKHKKQFAISSVVGRSEQLGECKCEYPIIRTGVTEYCSICQLEVK